MLFQEILPSQEVMSLREKVVEEVAKLARENKLYLTEIHNFPNKLMSIFARQACFGIDIRNHTEIRVRPADEILKYQVRFKIIGVDENNEPLKSITYKSGVEKVRAIKGSGGEYKLAPVFITINADEKGEFVTNVEEAWKILDQHGEGVKHCSRRESVRKNQWTVRELKPKALPKQKDRLEQLEEEFGRDRLAQALDKLLSESDGPKKGYKSK